jgi:hypothetical protein
MSKGSEQLNREEVAEPLKSTELRGCPPISSFFRSPWKRVYWGVKYENY